MFLEGQKLLNLVEKVVVLQSNEFFYSSIINFQLWKDKLYSEQKNTLEHGLHKKQIILMQQCPFAQISNRLVEKPQFLSKEEKIEKNSLCPSLLSRCFQHVKNNLTKP